MRKLLIIIINYNTKDLIDTCLKELMSLLNGLNYLITVVDNASNDGSIDLIKSKYKEVFLIENKKNIGFGAACNQAIKANPEYDYYLFVNSDTKPLKDSIRKMMEYMDKNPDCGILGSKLLNNDGSMQNSFANYPAFKTELFGKKIFQIINPKQNPHKRLKINSPLEVESVVGAFFMIRSKDFLNVSGFDERFFFFMEETDLCRQINLKGHKVIYHPEIQVIHYQGKSANKNPKWSRYNFYKSKYQFFKKWDGNLIFCIVYLINIFCFVIKSFFYLFINIITFFIIKHFREKFELASWLLSKHIQIANEVRG